MYISEEEKRSFLEKYSALPRIVLTDRQLFDLELILDGGFAPLDGFLGKDDYEGVVENMKLKDGSIWPIPIVLDIGKENNLNEGDKVLLCDSFGNPIAVLDINSLYSPDKEKEAKMVYGTNDKKHPGVRYLLDDTREIYAGGKVEGIGRSPKYDFKDLRHTPTELKKIFQEKGVKDVVAFQTRNPMHRAHVEIVKRSKESSGAHLLIHPVVGLTKEGDIDYVTRVRSYRKLYEKYLKDDATLALLPLAMRMAGPREALWHALIRKNHGATHFIIGRDHAGPGNDSQGKPFYGPYDAQNLAKKYESELGINIIAQPEMVYVDEIGGYLPTEEVKPEHTVKNISGTEFRRKIRAEEEIPSWFSYPEVIEELAKAEGRSSKGATIFFTGLSGAGKSTIANILKVKIGEQSDRSATLLDGDIVRENLSKGLGFSKEDRDTNILRIGFVASEITKHGGIAICSAIAPYEDARRKNRRLISSVGTYVEVYVSTPVEVCESRDVKGLYQKAKQGLISGFTGVNDPYESPVEPEITLDASGGNPEVLAEVVMCYLKDQGII
jgi:sulfate adenylyltransferase